jgi:adenosylcobinamide-phosphate synthase
VLKSRQEIYYNLLLRDFILILSFFSLLLALALDHRFAEPKKYHPLVGFGRYADFLEKKLNIPASPRINSRAQFINGVLACLLAIIPIMGVIIIVQHSLPSIINIFIDAGLLYLCIGWSSLQQHARAIFTELNINQLDLARTKLGWIVSRETETLDSTQISQAAVESVLENSSDALFASIFWFMVAGVEGAVLHRLINTLDAMWGYKTTQFLYFGRFSAYFDDLLNYLPARLTAYGFVFCACSVEQGKKALMCWRTQAKHCSSPNGGPVMTAGAGALSVLLSKGAFYHGKWEVKPTMGFGEVAQAHTIIESLDLVQKSLFFWLFSIGGLVFVL